MVGTGGQGFRLEERYGIGVLQRCSGADQGPRVDDGEHARVGIGQPFSKEFLAPGAQSVDKSRKPALQLKAAGTDVEESPGESVGPPVGERHGNARNGLGRRL